MTVTEKDRLVFEVTSTTVAGEVRTVDKSKYHGNGECDCWPFRKQIKPQLEEHLKAVKPRLFTYEPLRRHQCIHIQAVNDHVANRVIQAVRRAYPDDKQST